MRVLKLAVMLGFILGIHNVSVAQDDAPAPSPSSSPALQKSFEDYVNDLQSNDLAVQQVALSALSDDIPQAIQVLSAAIRDKANPMKKRANAAWAFGHIGIAEYVPAPALHEAFRDPEIAVQISAQRAFESLGILRETEEQMWANILAERQRQAAAKLTAQHNLLQFQASGDPSVIDVAVIKSLSETDRQAFTDIIEYLVTGHIDLAGRANLKSLPEADRQFFIDVLQRAVEQTEAVREKMEASRKSFEDAAGEIETWTKATVEWTEAELERRRAVERQRTPR